MKKRLIDFIYKFIEFFPPRIAEKIKIIGCVIFGDWYFIMRHPEFPLTKFKSCSVEKIRETFKELPENEINSILQYLQKVRQYSDLPYPENGMLLNYRNIMGDEYSDYLQMQKNMYAEIKKMKIKLPRVVLKNEEVMYFHHGLRFLNDKVKEYIKGKIFIDAGAFVGDSALVFANYYTPGKICSFEPSEINRKLYISFMKKNHIPDSSYILYSYGLGAKEEVISFYDSGTSGCSLKKEEEGEAVSTISVKTLDQLFLVSEEKIGVIKADVEGMGLDLVKGATEIIKRDLPVLALSIYHNEEELLGIYSYLKSLDLNYEYHVKCLSLNCCSVELTLIAIPQM